MGLECEFLRVPSGRLPRSPSLPPFPFHDRSDKLSSKGQARAQTFRELRESAVEMERMLHQLGRLPKTGALRSRCGVAAGGNIASTLAYNSSAVPAVRSSSGGGASHLCARSSAVTTTFATSGSSPTIVLACTTGATPRDVAKMLAPIVTKDMNLWPARPPIKNVRARAQSLNEVAHAQSTSHLRPPPQRSAPRGCQSVGNLPLSALQQLQQTSSSPPKGNNRKATLVPIVEGVEMGDVNEENPAKGQLRPKKSSQRSRSEKSPKETKNEDKPCSSRSAPTTPDGTPTEEKAPASSKGSGPFKWIANAFRSKNKEAEKDEKGKENKEKKARKQ